MVRTVPSWNMYTGNTDLVVTSPTKAPVSPSLPVLLLPLLWIPVLRTIEQGVDVAIVDSDGFKDDGAGMVGFEGGGKGASAGGVTVEDVDEFEFFDRGDHYGTASGVGGDVFARCSAAAL